MPLVTGKFIVCNYDDPGHGILLMKKSRLKTLGYIAVPAVLISVLIWIMFIRLPDTYSAVPITGRVVDAQTGSALSGAVVMAVWELRKGFGLEGTITAGALNIMEVLTDEEGHYELTAWGPLRRPTGTYLGSEAPRLIIFKDGYFYFSRGNDYGGTGQDRRRNNMQYSSWDGETIRLTRFAGPVEEYYQVLLSTYLDLAPVFDPTFGAGPCDWTKLPEMVERFDRYYQELSNRDGGNGTYFIPDMNYLLEGGNCTLEE